MDDDLTRRNEDRPLRRLILLAGAHSCVLGAAMLVAPRLVLSVFGFPPSDQLFFPSQSGIFLIILGLCYLRALIVPSFVLVLLVSKSLAVVFLLVHLAFLSAPPIIWGAAAVDAGFLAATGLLLLRRGQLAGVVRLGGPGA